MLHSRYYPVSLLKYWQKTKNRISKKSSAICRREICFFSQVQNKRILMPGLPMLPFISGMENSFIRQDWSELTVLFRVLPTLMKHNIIPWYQPGDIWVMQVLKDCHWCRNIRLTVPDLLKL